MNMWIVNKCKSDSVQSPQHVIEQIELLSFGMRTVFSHLGRLYIPWNLCSLVSRPKLSCSSAHRSFMHRSEQHSTWKWLVLRRNEIIFSILHLLAIIEKKNWNRNRFFRHISVCEGECKLLYHNHLLKIPAKLGENSALRVCCEIRIYGALEAYANGSTMNLISPLTSSILRSSGAVPIRQAATSYKHRKPLEIGFCVSRVCRMRRMIILSFMNEMQSQWHRCQNARSSSKRKPLGRICRCAASTMQPLILIEIENKQ